MKTQRGRKHARRTIEAYRVAAATALALCLSGCFSYVPTALETTPVGEDVRLLVTRQGGFELSAITNIDASVPLVRGRIVGREGAELLLSVPAAQRRDGFHTVQLNQTIRVPVDEIVGIERREFNGFNTALLAGGGVAVAVGIITVIMDAFGNTGLDTGPEPPEFRGSFFSIPIGR
jgi:hypothetical protein